MNRVFIIDTNNKNKDKPEYSPKYICVNSGSDAEADYFLSIGGKEVDVQKVSEIFGDKAAQASPLTVKVSEDGQIESFTPLAEPELSEETQAARARAKRDRLIASTDYLLMPDCPLDADQLEAVKAYRQALRDVPEQEGFPKAITWPEKPEVVA